MVGVREDSTLPLSLQAAHLSVPKQKHLLLPPSDLDGAQVSLPRISISLKIIKLYMRKTKASPGIQELAWNYEVDLP